MGNSDVRERGIHCCVVHNWDSKNKFLATGQHGAPGSAGLFMLVVDEGDIAGQAPRPNFLNAPWCLERQLKYGFSGCCSFLHARFRLPCNHRRSVRRA